MAIKTDAVEISAEYQNGLTYQRTMNFTREWAEYDRFKAGDQWPAPTARTKELPRPVINVVKFIVRTKKANVLSSPVKMIFTAEQLPPEAGEMAGKITQSAQDFTDFAELVWSDVQQTRMNQQAVDDAATFGPGIFYYYWDATKKGGNYLKFSGGLAGEILDPINLFVANPQQKDVQKQPWVILSSREDTDALIAAAQQQGQNPANIQPDKDVTDQAYTAAQTEMEGERKTNCLTKLYKVAIDPTNPAAGTEVYWTKVTANGSAVIVPPKSLTPPGSDYKMSLYPIEIFNWDERKKCIFGYGEIKGIIPFQKALNFGYGMMLMSVEKTAWPAMVAQQGVISQKPTNAPGEIIWVNGSNADGVKYLTPPNFSSMPIEVLDKMLDLTRTVTGATDVMNGEAIGANMAASAIVALQNLARLPIADIQDRFYDSIKNVGRIWTEFFKAYYNQPRVISGVDSKTNGPTARVFTGSDYADVDFGLEIDVGTASEYSDTLTMSLMDAMFAKGNISLAQYAKYYPSRVFPQGLRQEIENNAQQQAQQGKLTGALQEMAPEQLAQLKNDPEMLAKLAQTMGTGAVTSEQPQGTPQGLPQQGRSA